MASRFLALVPLLAALAGCVAHHPGPVDPQEAALELKFLHEDGLTRDRIVQRLGAPSGTFMNNLILTYRLDEDFEVTPAVLPTTAPIMPLTDEMYSLVLEFDTHGRLMRYTVVRIR